MHLQRGVLPHDAFVRCVGMGPQTKIVSYDPGAPLHERYQADQDLVASGRASPRPRREVIRDTTLTINTFFGWDFNSCELIRQDGVWHPFDFANPCPDSQVTSLHVHFPWLVLAKLRWALFCAATKRPMHQNLDWAPYFEIAGARRAVRGEAGRPTRAHRARAPRRRGLRRVRREAPGRASTRSRASSSAASGRKEAVRLKVQALFPEHEWDEFTDYFWARIQTWREGAH